MDGEGIENPFAGERRAVIALVVALANLGGGIYPTMRLLKEKPHTALLRPAVIDRFVYQECRVVTAMGIVFVLFVVDPAGLSRDGFSGSTIISPRRT